MLTEPPIRSRMLVVDDDEVMRELLLTLLDIEGHEVHVVDSGGAALDWLASAPMPDLILTDMQMPGMAGLALVKALRRAAPPSTQLLGMSGSRPNQSVLDGLDAFVLKPFGYADLEAAFNRLEEPLNGRTGEPTHVAHPPATDYPMDALPESSIDSLQAPSFQAPSLQAPSLQAPRSANTPVLDEAIFDSLRQSFRSAQLAELYTLTLNDVRVRQGRMEDYAAAGNLDALGREAHSIKGLCGMVGARELGTLAAAVEAGTTVDIFAIHEISAACARLRRMLDTKFATHIAPAGEHE